MLLIPVSISFTSPSSQPPHHHPNNSISFKPKKQNINAISREEENRENCTQWIHTLNYSAWFQCSQETARTVTNYRHLQKLQDKKCQLQFLILVEQPTAFFSFLLFPLLDQPWKSSLTRELDITCITHSYSPATLAETKQRSLLGSSSGFFPSKGKTAFF